MSIDMARIRREDMRWHLLTALNVVRPSGSYLEVLLPVIRSVYPGATDLELRREVDYLEERKLVTIKRDPMERWFVSLTRYGIDVAEYTVDVEPGISRPRPAAG